MKVSLLSYCNPYPNQDNPFLEYIDYAKSVLEGKVEDKKIFPMLYSLDKDFFSFETDIFTWENGLIELYIYGLINNLLYKS